MSIAPASGNDFYKFFFHPDSLVERHRPVKNIFIHITSLVAWAFAALSLVGLALPLAAYCLRDKHWSQLQYPKLFSGSMSDRLAYEKEKGIGNGQLPALVEKCVAFLESGENMKRVDIYRLSAHEERLKTAFNKAKRVGIQNFSEGEDEIFVACALKKYVRELVEKDPLFSDLSFEGLEKDVKARFFEAIKNLPAPKKDLLHRICGHLQKVSSFSGENNMDTENLATCWAQNFLPYTPPPGTDPYTALEQFRKRNTLFQTLLDSNLDEVFGPSLSSAS